VARREKAIVNAILRLLRSHAAFAEKIHGSAMQRAGLPDIMGCHRGQFFGLEVKRPGQDATDLQLEVLREISASGGISAVVRSVDEVRELFRW